MADFEYKYYDNNASYVVYDERMGTINYPDGFFDKLRGLSIEEQKELFRISYSDKYCHTGWTERETKWLKKLADCSAVEGIIIKDDYIAGILVENAWGELCSVLPEHSVTTHYSSDNNGAGYKEIIYRLYLLCVNNHSIEDEQKDN